MIDITDVVYKEDFQEFIFSADFFKIVMFAVAVTVIVNFIRQLNRLMGQNVFLNYIMGKYHHPKEEERIIMFLDMRSSTSIAEKLGHYRFHEFISEVFYDGADETCRESLSLFREVENTKEIAGAYGNLAEVALSRRDYESARTSAEESLALYRELDDKHGVATALRTLSYASHNQGNIQQAQMAAEQGVTLFRQLGDRGCLGLTLSALARHVLGQGDVGRAEEIIQEAVMVLHEVGELTSEIGSLDVAGRVALAQGDLFKAQKHFRDGISYLKDSKEVSQLPPLLEGLANTLARSAQTHNAILFLGDTARARLSVGTGDHQDSQRGEGSRRCWTCWQFKKDAFHSR